MWLKNQSILTQIGAIFLLAYTLIIQKPYTGVTFEFISKAAPITSDLSSDEVFYKKSQGKMKIAAEKPLPKVASISIPKQTPKPTAQTPTDTTDTVIEEEYSDVKKTIKSAAKQYNVNPNIMLSIAKCESGFDENATSGQYAGLFQFHPSTWQSNRREMGVDDATNLRFNAQEAAITAAFKMSRDGFEAWPECSQKAFLAARE